jgi:phage tail-like protein
VTPNVTGVTPGYAADVVNLTLDLDMTRGATYLLTVSGVTDLVGNVSAAPTNTTRFLGWSSSAPGRDFSIWAWWPTADKLADTQGELQNFLACFQEVVDLLLGKIDGFLDILDPDTAPAAWLPSMLADVGNPFGMLLAGMSADDLRRLLHALVPIYQLKGTDAGIIQALNFFLGITATVTYEAWGGPGLGSAWLSGTVVVPTGGPSGYAFRLGASLPRELMTFYVNVPAGLDTTQTTRGLAIVQYMRRAGTRPVWRPPQPSPNPPIPLGEWTLGPGGTWVLA